MTTDTWGLRSLFAWRARSAPVMPWMRKDGPLLGHEDEVRARTAQDLLRLAETSPHLLEDIGFTEAPGTSDSGLRLLRRAGFTIEIRRGETVRVGTGR